MSRFSQRWLWGGFVASLMVISAPHGLQAASVELLLEADQDAGSWSAFARVLGNNIAFEQDSADPGDVILGIASVSIQLTATGDLVVTSAQNETPQGFDSNANATGFSLFRSNGILSNGNLTDLTAGQSTFLADPTGLRVLEGAGFSAGVGGEDILESAWDFPFLIVTGTFSGEEGTLTLAANGDNLSIPLLYGSGQWDDPQQIEEAEAILSASVTFPLEEIPGDYDRDRDVDIDDYTEWVDQFGSVVSGFIADGNLDDVVNAADYTIWRAWLERRLSLGRRQSPNRLPPY